MGYALVDIATLELQTFRLAPFENGTEVQCDFGHVFSILEDQSIVQLILKFEFKVKGVRVGYIRTGFGFHFENLEEYLDPNNSARKELKKDVQRQLYAVGVGTTRGIFFAKSEIGGAQLHIPILNPNEQIPE